MDDALPIIIPANNEEEGIKRCLDSLPKKRALPLVVANGCSDNTANVAKDQGATTYVIEEGSKLGAIQHALRLHVKPGQPFVILDADSRIVFPNHFVQQVFQKTEKRSCVVLNGILAYSLDGAIGKVAYVPSFARVGYVLKAQYLSRVAVVTGQAQIIKPDEMALTAILELPSLIWPGEDIALVDMIYKSGGSTALSLDPRLTVITSRRGMGHLYQRIFHPKAWAAHRAVWWGSRARKDSLSYAEYLLEAQAAVSPELAYKMMYMPVRKDRET